MTCYDLPLSSWISIALHKDTLSSALEAIRSNKPLEDSLDEKPDNRRYIEKILKEEVINQFSEQSRPLLEIILNSIDAKEHDEYKDNYSIKVQVGVGKFVSKDNGRGMSLDEILRLLIIPSNNCKPGMKLRRNSLLAFPLGKGRKSLIGHSLAHTSFPAMIRLRLRHPD